MILDARTIATLAVFIVGMDVVSYKHRLSYNAQNKCGPTLLTLFKTLAMVTLGVLILFSFPERHAGKDSCPSYSSLYIANDVDTALFIAGRVGMPLWVFRGLSLALGVLCCLSSISLIRTLVLTVRIW